MGITVFAFAPFSKRRAFILTLDQTDRFIEDGINIEIKPAWKWLD